MSSPSPATAAQEQARNASCRYRSAGCLDRGTHFCAECGQTYCAAHAERHDRLILDEFERLGITNPLDAILTKPIG